MDACLGLQREIQIWPFLSWGLTTKTPRTCVLCLFFRSSYFALWRFPVTGHQPHLAVCRLVPRGFDSVTTIKIDDNSHFPLPCSDLAILPSVRLNVSTGGNRTGVMLELSDSRGPRCCVRPRRRAGPSLPFKECLEEKRVAWYIFI